MKTLTQKMVMLTLVLIFNQSIKAQVMDLWMDSKDNGATDRALVVHPEGSYIHVAGTTERPEGLKLFTRKYNTDGIRQWSRTGNTVLPGPVLFIKRDSDLNTFVVCNNLSTGNYTIIKYGRDANQKWKKNFTEHPVGLEIDGTGKIYTGGQASGGFFARCYRNSNGNVLWARSESEGIEAKGMDIDNSGNVYIGGLDRLRYAVEEDIRIVKFGISSYTTIWATNWDGPVYNRDNVEKLTVDNVGNVYIAGEADAYGSMGANLSVIKFSSTGSYRWHHMVSGGGSSHTDPVTLLVDQSQNPVLVAEKTDFYNVSITNETDRILVTKLNRNTGDELFLVYPNDPTYTDPNIREEPICASLDQYGNIYVGASGNNGGFAHDENRWTITKVDGVDGHLKWVEAGGPVTTGESQVNDVYVAPNGDVYLAISETSTSINFVVWKYSQPGGGLRLASENWMEKENSFPSISIYPNPSNNIFILKNLFPDESILIEVFDITGKKVFLYENAMETFSFGDDLMEGVYLVCLKIKDERKTYTIVKTK